MDTPGRPHNRSANSTQLTVESPLRGVFRLPSFSTS
jgi:hypothetical protein